MRTAARSSSIPRWTHTATKRPISRRVAREAPATPVASSSWSRTEVAVRNALMRAELLIPMPPGRGPVVDREHRHRARRWGRHPSVRRWPKPAHWFRSEQSSACANLRAIPTQATGYPDPRAKFKKICFQVPGRRWHRFVGGAEPGAPGSGRASISRGNSIYCSAIIDCLVAARPDWVEQPGIEGLLQKRNTVMKVSAIFVAHALPGSGAQMAGDLA